LSFTVWAVVTAQVVVSAPFYIQSAAAGFRKVDDDQLLVAQTLGATPGKAFLRIAVPTALPALMSGAALCWARALGEFGATLLFAGNLPGQTQTMPLAIYSAMEQDLELARALALILAIFAFAMLLLLRLIPAWRRQRIEARR
jgi:molybdate transport system permease protein